ncbi:hypothetical protein BKP37_15620 [Anaerobacillus alkalilacustris]|uniref:Uncharacterized protein n=1 Tax=Anaerobacillus alkalilacustris TaxID=393763 RepID=A0A1S2LGH2_9BACI|nr:Ger(x)C family spore germination protein [Anaerobacillus alkalilacustris]OIJ11466.1 hypothetical protein BKP37_15620 [Anaerobacillus alkalilacustris]
MVITKKILFFLWSLLVLSGCWSQNELNELAIVSAVAIDYMEDLDEYLVSFEILDPLEVAGGEQGGSGVTTTIYEARDATLFGAIRLASRTSPRRLYFPHMQLMVISEAIARSGIDEVLDIFERNRDSRLTVPVVISQKGKAVEVLEILPSLERVPSNYLFHTLTVTDDLLARNRVVTMLEIINALTSEGREVALSGVTIIGDKEKAKTLDNIQRAKSFATTQVFGLGLFKNGKLQGWLKEENARGASWVMDDVDSTVMTLPYEDQEDVIAVEIVRSETELTFLKMKPEPTFKVSISTEGHIVEVDVPITLSETKEINKLEEQLEKLIKAEIETAIRAAQNVQSDIFGFGEILNRSNPKEWKEIKDQWPEHFEKSKFIVEVNGFIRRTGMRMEPLH